ncbi:MAG: response regulator [Leptolyngbyaceae cyanobacterium SM2_5_2]|nr:response regulator [Leptolyngbyaceae cyanobacterium SM2_5_2]
MLPEDQKRILGYFIEEAKDHLNTIEQGLLNLQATIHDPEMINEVFRAAHSVKGGAAMLGLNSIQRTSHRMEDFFKLMKDFPIRPDRELESLLLQIADGLQDQLEQLQTPFGLTDDQAQVIMTTLEPVFGQAETHLQTLVEAAPVASVVVPVALAARPGVEATSHPETSALHLVFRSDVPELLREMLTAFKQPDGVTSRQQLGQICQRLHSLGEQFELSQWCHLAQSVAQVVGNPQQTYRTLAAVVIRDLKQAQELVLAGHGSQISPSSALLALLPPAPAEADLALEALLNAALEEGPAEADLVEPLISADLASATALTDTDALTNTDDWLTELTVTGDLHQPAPAAGSGEFDLTLATASTPAPQHHPGVGPQVGDEELNSLADLFEGEALNLDGLWEDEDIQDLSQADDFNADLTADDLDDEFADLFQTGLGDSSLPKNSAADGYPLEDDMASLFGHALVDDILVEQAPEAAPVAATAGGKDNALEEASPPISEASDLTSAEEPEDFEGFFDGSQLTVPTSTAAVDEFFALDQASTAAEVPPSLANSTHPEAIANLDSGLDLAEPSEPAPESALDINDPFSTLTARLDIDGSPETDLGDLFDAIEVGDPFGAEAADLDDLGLAIPNPIPAVPDIASMATDQTPDVPETNSSVAPADPFGELSLDGLSWLNDDSQLLDSAAELAPEPLPKPSMEADNEPFVLPSDEPWDTFGTLDALLADDLPSGEVDASSWQEPVQPAFSPFEPASTTSPEANTSEVNLPAEEPASLTGVDNPDDDGFGDLEKLLEEADQLGGSGPVMGGRRTSIAVSPRMPRRSNAMADQTMRVSVSHLDNLSNLVGELVVNRNSLEQDQERLRQFLDNLLHQVQQLNDVGQRMRDLYERSLLESSLMANRQSFALGPVASYGGSHATGATFDALEMDRFTGFHTLSQEMIELIVRVREASSDIEFTIDSTDQIARQFRQVTTQLQEGLNKARMVPFGQTADRLPRAVRDISLRCDKEAKLVVEGRDTLIDKMILERLYDPMTHLVNNAISHGIESPDERAALGKAREGTITVRAFYQGNQTVIYIADNGGGINPGLVKAKALEKGIITPAEAQTMTDLEVYDLLFLPGFTTRDQADAFSGRGVGMDVVRTALADIRGSITIESEVGKGTSFTIRLPLTLSITKALSCVNNQARIAFPMDGVEDMFDVPRERIQTDDQGHSGILWRDMLLPCRPLGDLLKFNRSLGRGRVYGGPQDDNRISIVVLRSASTFIGLQVDQVIGEQEIVIKQLEGPVPKPTGIAGATVLGDGRVMPIADVLELIDLATGRVRRDAPSSLWSQPEIEDPSEASAQSEPTVLIVDDSITVRELLSMSFNKVGYRVEQARDGQEAWEKLRSGLPCDLVFCDIEMPRMDGLELLSRLQKDDLLSQIPIAMLTSRGADRHRQMAIDLGAKGYFTKPYLEEMLLDAAQRMLQGETMIAQKTASPL